MKARTLLVLLALVAAALILWRPGRVPDRTEVGVTSDLAGRWTTTGDPRYADRYLEITTDEIAFGQGEEQESRHHLIGVFLEAADRGPASYVIRYEVEPGSETTVDLRAVVEENALRLEHPPGIVWTRSP